MLRKLTQRILMLCIFSMVWISNGSGQEKQRIISAGGSVTEIIYELSAQDQLVGVDSSSTFPNEAISQKSNIGYFRSLAAEGLLSLKPDLVLAIEGAGPPHTFEQLKGAGVGVINISNEYSAQGVINKVTRIGEIIDRKNEAQKLSQKLSIDFQELKMKSSKIAKKARVLFVMSMQNGRPLVAGKLTAADAMIGLSGGVNVANIHEGYKPITDEALILAAPDVIVMMNAHSSKQIDAEQLLALNTIAQTNAGKNKRIITMDGNYLLGFGPRTAQAAQDLMQALYLSQKISHAYNE